MSKKKSKQRPGHYFCEVHRMNYYFFLGWGWKSFCSHMNKNYDYAPQGHPRLLGQTIDLEYGPKGNRRAGMFIYLKHKKDYATLAHECLHATNRTLETNGWHPDLLNDEPQAYLLTNLVRQALEVI